VIVTCALQDPDLSITSLCRRNSTGVLVGSHLPHLISMDDDILCTGIRLYHLKVYNKLYTAVHPYFVHTYRLLQNLLSV